MICGFQLRGARYCRPSKWREDAVAMTTRTRLPTVGGWWQTIPPIVAPLWDAFVDAGVASGFAACSRRTRPAVDAAVSLSLRTPTHAGAHSPWKTCLHTRPANVPGTLRRNRTGGSLRSQRLCARPSQPPSAGLACSGAGDRDPRATQRLPCHKTFTLRRTRCIGALLRPILRQPH